MKKLNLTNIDVPVSALSLGLMRIGDLDIKRAATLIETAHQVGIHFFDHADIYGGGACERIFGQALKETQIPREQLMIQTKCSIRSFNNWAFKTYDSSKTYILDQVEASLSHLDTDYLDVLLLHRPDTLMEPEEISEAFEYLHSRGLVRHFGVSNYTPMQMELLQKYLDMPLIFNQLQFGLGHTHLVDRGFFANRKEQQATDRTGDLLEYCRYKGITIQAWSPFQGKEGLIFEAEQYPALNQAMNQLAEKYKVTNTAIATAWILRHPAQMQVILGTTTPQRVKDAAAAGGIKLTREEWYDLYVKTGVSLP